MLCPAGETPGGEDDHHVGPLGIHHLLQGYRRVQGGETGSLYTPTLGCSSCGVERDLSSAGDDYIVGEDSQDVLRASLTLLEFLTKHCPGQSLPLACQSEEAHSSVWESDTDTLLWRQSDSKQGKAPLDLNLLSTSLSMF